MVRGHSQLATSLSNEEALQRADQWWPAFVPSVPYSGVHKPWPGVCLNCGNPVSPRLSGARRQGFCPYCAGNRLDDAVVMGKMLAVDLFPLEPYPGPLVQWRCKCLRCNAIVTPKYNSVDQKGSGCEKCGRALARRRATLTRTTPAEGASLLDLYPEVAALAYGWDPSKVKPNSTRRVRWRCAENHITSAQVVHRTKGATCRVCSSRIAGRVTMTPQPGASLLEVLPDIAAQAEGWDPSTVKPKSKQRLLWRCAENHIWEAEVHVRANGSGCPECAQYGFNPSLGAFIYVVASPNWVKLGISNDDALETRLAKHRRQGLDQLVFAYQCESGRDARAVELLWLEFIRELPDLSRPTRRDLRDGYTEAVANTPEINDWLRENLLPLLGVDTEGE